MAKKVGRGILYVVLFCISLRACGAIVLGGHDWQGATCTEPRTCATCNAQRGKPLGHDWQEATCTAPRTCARCGETEGSCVDHEWVNATCTEAEHCSMCGEMRYRNSLPLGHEWREATCTEPKICTRCGEIEGDALGHSWMEATCLAPKTCSTCGETEGSIAKGHHTWVAATCVSPKTCSVCGKTEGKKVKEHTWVDATCTEAEHCSVCGKENLYSEPLGHDWKPATTETPLMCSRCGITEGEPVPLSSLNRGHYDNQRAKPSAEQYVGMNGYVGLHMTTIYIHLQVIHHTKTTGFQNLGMQGLMKKTSSYGIRLGRWSIKHQLQ